MVGQADPEDPHASDKPLALSLVRLARGPPIATSFELQPRAEYLRLEESRCDKFIKSPPRMDLPPPLDLGDAGIVGWHGRQGAQSRDSVVEAVTDEPGRGDGGGDFLRPGARIGDHSFAKAHGVRVNTAGSH